MKNRRIVWAVIAVVVMAVVAVVIPASPVYLPKLLNSGNQADGRTITPIGDWIKDLDSPVPQVRIAAIRAIGNMGHDGEEAAPALSKIMVEDSDRVLRNEAALSLSKMTAPSAVPALTKALEDKEPIIRINACRALSKLKTDARPAVPALVKAMMDEANDTNAKTFPFTIQEIAAQAIGRATTGTADGVPDLLAALASAKSVGMRKSIARALGFVGPEARMALPQLRAMLSDSDKDLKEFAAESIKLIGVDPKGN